MSDLAPESMGDAATRAAVRAALDRLGEAEVIAMAQSAPVGLFAGTADCGPVLANAPLRRDRGNDRLGDLRRR